MRIATLSLLLIFMTQAGFAQIGVQTGQPVSKTPTKAAMNVSDTPADTTECDIKPGWWPLKNKKPKDALCFWNSTKQEYLKYARFISSSKSMSASTEMVTDVFGTVRVTMVAAVAATTDEDSSATTTAQDSDTDEPTASQDKTLNLFQTNGGNLSVTASYPVYYKPIGTGQFLWNSYVRFAGNVDAMGGDTNEVTVAEDDFNGNVEVAFSELQVDMLSYQEKFNLLGYVKGSGVVGTKKFAAALGTDVGRSFLHGQVGAGLRVAGNLTVYFTYNWYSDDHIPGSGGAITLVIGD